MTDKYIYNYILGDKERSLISIFLRNKAIEDKANKKYRNLSLINIETLFEKIYKDFNISPHFTRNYIWPDILKTEPIKLGHKNCAYYDDEMLYGKLNLNYNIDDFSISELLAYNND